MARRLTHWVVWRADIQGHVVVAEELTDIDQHMLKKFARRLGLKVTVTRNSDEWLDDKKGVSEHKSKAEYTVDHLRSGGSDFRASASKRLEPEPLDREESTPESGR